MRVASGRVMSEVVANSASLVGQCLAGKFELEHCIGNGTAGDTYRAKHVELQRCLVVKVFHGDVRDYAQKRRRFEFEAGKLAELSHPNTPAVRGFGVHEGRRYVVREWLEGQTLANRLEDGPLSPEAAMSIARQLLAALAAAQAVNLPHRNLHPSNVFLESRKHGGERVKLLDFSPASRAGRQDPTPYTPPEQRAGERLDARSDVFAVGVMVGAMLRSANQGGAGAARMSTNTSAPHPASTGAVGAAHLTGDGHTTQSALASAAVVAVLSTSASGSAAPTEPVTDSVFTSSPAIDPARVDSALVSAFETAFAPPVVTATRPETAATLETETPLQRWIRRATAPERHERFENAAEMLRELVDHVPRAMRTTSEQARKAQRAPLPSPQPSPASSAPTQPESSRTTPLPLAKTLPPPSPPEPRGETSLPEVSPIALHSAVEPGTTQLTAATAIGAFTFAAVVIFVMPGEHGRASRVTPQPRPRAAAPAQINPEARIEAAKRPEPLIPIALGTIELGSNASSTSPQPSAAAPAPASSLKPKLGKGAPPRDPWLDPMPKELQKLRASAAGGAVGDKATIETLRLYNREHPNDTRGFLVTARFYLNRFWRSDGVLQLAAALERDPTVRGAPEILPALLEVVAEGKGTGTAEALIEKVYGTGAVPAIDQALDRVKTQSAALRLSTLSERLLARAQ